MERFLEVCTNLEFENIVGTGNPEEVKKFTKFTNFDSL